MNVRIHALLLVVFLAGTYAWRNPCPSEDRKYATILGNRVDCSSFFICSNGVPVRFQCPDGLEFNWRLRVCDWPESANCRVNGRPGKYGKDNWNEDKPSSKVELESEVAEEV